ncbi:MAG: dihydrofolate reductase [Gammaproteobacteria bacterium RBG_16_57_12]|nr:MAG: dihydrofolate reductase [Gammaproteobacteria bacterium RBG_16_57_12]
MISIIVAMADNRVIGIGNRLPWHLPGDLKWFRQNTLGKPVIMGRKTFESIGRPLPDRTNIIVTRDRDYHQAGCLVAHSIDEALNACREAAEVMIMGGASFYEQLLPRADRLYLTQVHAEVPGDAWFPDIDWTQWRETWREDHGGDDKNPYPYSLVRYERIRPTTSAS